MRVLFVDDDANILRSFKRLLMGLGAGIHGSFATDGANALDMLTTQEFDVVVADMRMPVMSGAELLSNVQKLYPGVVRIILSGQSDQKAMLDSVKPAHQFLSKPCTSEHMLATLKEAMRLKSILANESIRSSVAQIGSLPSLPAIYEEFMAEVRKDNYSNTRLGAIVARDMAMTANLLKVINSSYFGLSRTIETPADAINYLGLEMVKSLILGVHLFSELKGCPEIGISLPLLWDHSMRTANLVKCLTEQLAMDKKQIGACYLAGILHDIGKLILVDKCCEEYAKAVEFANRENVCIYDAEKAVLGCTHAEVGAYLIGLWSLPAEVVDAITHHHTPAESGIRSIYHPLPLVHMANAMDHQSFVFNKRYAPHQMDEAFLATACPDKEQLEQLLGTCSYTESEEQAHAQ